MDIKEKALESSFSSCFKYIFQFSHELINILELPVHRGKPDIGNLVPILQAVYDLLSYLLAFDLFFSKLLKIDLQGINKIIYHGHADRPFLAGIFYTGYYLELYVDVVLDAFKPFSGTFQSSTRPLTIGRMDNTETLYSLRGSVDEFRLWDKEISIPQIEKLKTQWATPFGFEENDPVARIYPNPSNGDFVIELTGTKSSIIYKPLPSDDPMQRQPNIEKAKKLLNWEPKIQLREGLMKTIAYFDQII